MKRKTKCIYKDNNCYVVNMFIVSTMEEAQQEIDRLNFMVKYDKELDINDYFTTNLNEIKTDGYGIIEYYLPISSYCKLVSMCGRIANEKQFWLIYKTILNFYKTSVNDDNKKYFTEILTQLQQTYVTTKTEQIEREKFHDYNVFLGLCEESIDLCIDEETGEICLLEDC